MCEFTLSAMVPLDTYRREFGAANLAERTGFDLVSLSVSHNCAPEFARAVEGVWGTAPPGPGRSVRANGGARLLSIQPGQYFLLFQGDDRRPAEAVSQKIGATAHVTDQSDGWAMLALSGPNAPAIMERLCMLDLHEDRFPVGAVSRTVMEHHGVILLREAGDTYLMLSPRSYARSFLHAVETACESG